MIACFNFATPTYAAAVALRHQVLRLPLGRDIADDPLAEEWAQQHIGAFQDGELIGTASLLTTPTGIKMRQVAVAPAHHGRGVGRALVAACERLAGQQRLYCHARLTALPFYERCGWVAVGKRFEEVGIEHQVMERPATDSA